MKVKNRGRNGQMQPFLSSSVLALCSALDMLPALPAHPSQRPLSPHHSIHLSISLQRGIVCPQSKIPQLKDTCKSIFKGSRGEGASEQVVSRPPRHARRHIHAFSPSHPRTRLSPSPFKGLATCGYLSVNSLKLKNKIKVQFLHHASHISRAQQPNARIKKQKVAD